MVGRATPDIDEAKAALKGIVKEGNRASEVIGRIRAMLRHRKPEYVSLDINDTIREVLALAMNALHKPGIAVQTAVAGGTAARAGRPRTAFSR